jgi:hypothetical protein
MTPEQQTETIALQRQMHAYFDSLAVAGIPEPIIVTAAIVAASQRVLKVSTPTQAAAFLRGHALNMEKFGPAMKKAMGQD